MVTLALMFESRKNKQVLFTEAGKELVEQKIVPMVQAEERSFERLEEWEREQLLSITRRHIEILEEEINRIE